MQFTHWRHLKEAKLESISLKRKKLNLIISVGNYYATLLLSSSLSPKKTTLFQFLTYVFFHGVTKGEVSFQREIAFLRSFCLKFSDLKCLCNENSVFLISFLWEISLKMIQ